MPVNLFTDASLKGSETRGCYIITKNNQNKGFKSSTNYNQIKMFRTPIVEVDTKINKPTICDMEFKTIIEALVHAIKLHPEEKFFTVYSDSLPAIARIDKPWYEIQQNGMEPMLLKLHDYIASTNRVIKIKIKHVKAHKDNLAGNPEKFNFMCDIFASVVNKI